MAENGNDSVFIGRKPVMNYVLACMTVFQDGATEVCLKARGMAMSRAVDVAEILRRRFLTNINVMDIRISTEQMVREEGGNPSNVSAIEIVLAKQA